MLRVVEVLSDGRCPGKPDQAASPSALSPVQAIVFILLQLSSLAGRCYNPIKFFMMLIKCMLDFA